MTTTGVHFGHRAGAVNVYRPGASARENEPSTSLTTDVAAPPPNGTALTVALATALAGQGDSIRSTGQTGPARTRPVIPPVTAPDGGRVLEGTLQPVVEGDDVPGISEDPQPGVAVKTVRRLILAITLDSN